MKDIKDINEWTDIHVRGLEDFYCWNFHTPQGTGRFSALFTEIPVIPLTEVGANSKM